MVNNSFSAFFAIYRNIHTGTSIPCGYFSSTSWTIYRFWFRHKNLVSCNKKTPPFFGSVLFWFLHFILYNNCYGTRLERVSDKNRGKNNPMYGKPSHNRKKVKCITTGEVFDSIHEASQKYKCNPSHIIENCKGKIKSCSKLQDGTKLIWEYYKEEI